MGPGCSERRSRVPQRGSGVGSAFPPRLSLRGGRGRRSKSYLNSELTANDPDFLKVILLWLLIRIICTFMDVTVLSLDLKVPAPGS